MSVFDPRKDYQFEDKSMKLNLTKEQWMAMADREGDAEVGAGLPPEFYAPVKGRDFVEMLPDGVHELSWESQVTLANAYMRGWRIARRHIKRAAD